MTMHVRDASGRRVSLLNDDDASSSKQYQPYFADQYPTDTSYAAYYSQAPRSASSSPNTPELLRSDSYDSQMGGEPLSPMTPLYDPRYPATPADPRVQYDDYYVDPQIYAGTKHPYEDDMTSHSSTNERSGKRFPCRYRDTHGCEKTFTTSGHASRHSKIHTAEKAVPCSFPGCSKKFTRADNMKQHLETHYKDKSRSSATRPSLVSSDRRSSTTGKSSRSKSSSSTVTLSNTTPLPSPGGVWDMRSLQPNLPLLTRPMPTTGLDALALAVACQEGS
ncbi:hypothetical protein QBC35DRAFT_197565 [Podospora australis]|uniref:C2H2-type domain-containing protein n=1 Tax=Podospora australis TaxID=1536484 RepID=A0AAN6X236_9PEZI|nr:hypothetical protein QBC35DRAFT_197565 [Podospora australis]